jgi:excisionase family DNA binding protein
MATTRQKHDPTPDHDCACKMCEERATFAEAMKILRVGRTTLQRMVALGELDHYKVRGRLQFDKADLRAYLDSCRVEAGR